MCPHEHTHKQRDSPDVGEAIPPTEMLDKEQPGRRKGRVERNVEAAVAIKQTGRRTLILLLVLILPPVCWPAVFVSHDEHGHLRAVLALVPDLPRPEENTGGMVWYGMA